MTVALAAATPALDYAMAHFPLLKTILPGNVYAIGFAAIVIGNIIVQFRDVIFPPYDDDKKEDDKKGGA